MIVTFEYDYLKELSEVGKTQGKKYRFQPQIMKVHIAGIPDNMIANNLTSSYAIHPGEIIKDELEARGITQKQLADETGIPISVLNAVLEGKREVTTEYALLFEAALDIDADFWLRFQSDYNKQIIKSNPDFMSRLKNVRKIVAAL